MSVADNNNNNNNNNNNKNNIYNNIIIIIKNSGGTCKIMVWRGRPEILLRFVKVAVVGCSH